MLNKYYSLMDDSVVYRVAMSMLFICYLLLSLIPFIVLHPHYKISYFSRAKWPEQWILDAKKIACEV